MDKKIIYEYDRRNRELFTQQIENNSGCIVNWAFFSKNDNCEILIVSGLTVL